MWWQCIKFKGCLKRLLAPFKVSVTYIQAVPLSNLCIAK